jgi:hypothetical protein
MIGAILVVVALWWNRIGTLTPAWRVALAASVMAPMLFGMAAAGCARVSQWAAVASLPPGQTPADAQKVLQETIPDGAVVLADDLWPQLVPRCEVYDASMGLVSDPDPVLQKVEYVALTANYSPEPGQRKRLFKPEFEEYLDRHFEVIHDQAGEQKLKFLGATVPSPAHGFGPIILKRKQPAWVRWVDSNEPDNPFR